MLKTMFINVLNLKFQKNMNVVENVIVYVGMTRSEFLKKKLGVADIFSKFKDNQTYAFRAKEIFLHPKLQTSKVRYKIIICILS